VTTVIEEWHRKQIITITPRDCKWNFPLLAAPKKDAKGDWNDIRVCVNFRILNRYIEDEPYMILLPLISEPLKGLPLRQLSI
jgi:hypothetical protein